MAKLDFYGHATFGLTTEDGTRIIIDPFFVENPLIAPSLIQWCEGMQFSKCIPGHWNHFSRSIQFHST